MPHLVRCWLGLAALGAGLIHLGVASRQTAALLALLSVVGAAEVAWGVAALARLTVPLVRTAFAVSVLAVGGWALTLLVAAGGAHAGHAAHVVLAPEAALGGAALLDLLAAVGLAVVLRRRAGPAGEPRTAPMLIGTAAGAIVVALVVANALGSVFSGGMSMH